MKPWPLRRQKTSTPSGAVVTSPRMFLREWYSAVSAPPFQLRAKNDNAVLCRFTDECAAATIAAPQPGDPVKAAAVIIHIAGLDELPLRLLLGSDSSGGADCQRADRSRQEVAGVERLHRLRGRRQRKSLCLGTKMRSEEALARPTATDVFYSYSIEMR